MTYTKKIRVGNFRTSNIMRVHCMNCACEFAKRRFAAKSQAKNTIRPSNAVTCSSECSRELRSKQAGYANGLRKVLG